MLSKIYKLLRIKPTLGWSGSCILAAAVLAVSESYPIPAFYLLAMLVVLVAQSLLAHSLNDLADYDVDRIAKIKETGRSDKLLVTGDLTASQMRLIAALSLLVYLLIGTYLALKISLLIYVFLAVGLYAAICYSLPPLKLGWRPFAEWTVVFPVISATVLGLYFVATLGHLSLTACIVAAGLALLSMNPFTVSRLLDVDVDERMGKRTTGVCLKEKTPYLALVYGGLGIFFLFFLTLPLTAAALAYIAFATFLVVTLGGVCGAAKVGDLKALGKFRARLFYFTFGAVVIWASMLLL